jgi:hypothetical protein
LGAVSGADALAFARAARDAPAQWSAWAAQRDALARDGLVRVVVCGMGGSSLAAGVLAEAFGAANLVVLDTTAPERIAAEAQAADATPTVFVIASKTGTTVETDAFHRFFAARARPDQFIAITDPGSPLEALARAQGFRAVVTAPPDVGGRYSALTAFGMLPAALAGLDGATLLARAQEVDVAAARVRGVKLATAARAGRDKFVLEAPPAVAGLATWIEQLVAESSGKSGRGVIPVVDDPLRGARADVLPITEFSSDPLDLGAEFLRWEYATWELCGSLGVNPFDQPDVDEAKRLTRAVLERPPGSTSVPGTLTPRGLAAAARARDYFALLLYAAPTRETAAAARELRAAWSRKTGVVSTFGWGPRYLHSTGQLHKGGPNTGLFLVVTVDSPADVEIPGRPFTFGRLLRAQALGDVAALLRRGRRVSYVHLPSVRDLDRLKP